MPLGNYENGDQYSSPLGQSSILHVAIVEYMFIDVHVNIVSLLSFNNLKDSIIVSGIINLAKVADLLVTSRRLTAKWYVDIVLKNYVNCLGVAPKFLFM